MMDGTVVFAAAYATLIVLAAIGIDRVGERTGRGTPHDPTLATWPRTGSVAVHTVVAVVAAVASMLIAVVVGVQHLEVGNVLLLAMPTALSVWALRRLGVRLRTAVRD